MIKLIQQLESKSEQVKATLWKNEAQ